MKKTDISRHFDEINHNQVIWNSKPLLRNIYMDFYRIISSHINRDPAGKIVELGSGIGNLKEFFPESVSTDLVGNPWIDQVENAYGLTFTDQSVSNLILFDVFHHLEFPGTALDEFARVLMPGGRLIIFEPSVSLLGLLVYGIFHHEPLGLFRKIAWNTDKNMTGNPNRYYAAQGNASRIFLSRKYSEQLSPWKNLVIKKYSAFSYIASGGYGKFQLYPGSLYPFLKKIDNLLDLIPPVFSTRLLVVLEKQ